MRWMLIGLMTMNLIGFFAQPVAAQVPVNPTGVEWTMDSVEDHNNTLRYKLNIYDQAGGAMVRVVTIVGPMIDNVTLTVTTTWNSMPLAFGNYEAGLQACWDDALGTEQCTVESVRSNEFHRRPGRPGGLVVLP